MNIKKYKTILCRLFAFLFFAALLGVSNAEAQLILKANITLDCNSADGGRWIIPSVGIGDPTAMEYYDGFSDDYEISCYFAQYTCYTADTVLCNRRGLSDLSQLGNILVNDNGYFFDGWVDRFGTPHSLSDPLCTNDGAYLFAVWRQNILLEPEFEWSVSINNINSFQPKSNNGTTSLAYGSSIYLQASLIPDLTNSIEYDDWSIVYHNSEGEYFNSPKVSKYNSIILEKANPYNKPGKTVYTIDIIRLYINNVNITIHNNNSYSYTLEIGNAPLTDPELQWSASINNATTFKNYDNNSELTIGWDESIFLRLCPFGGTYSYDNWSIQYSVKPASYHIPAGTISEQNCFMFNNSLPYSDFEKLEFEVTSMTLFSQGQTIRTIQFAKPYKFTIEKEEPTEPVIQLCVSAGSYNSCSSTGSEIVINPNEPVTLSLCVSGGNIEFDQWTFNYSSGTSNNNVEAGVMDKTECFVFESVGTYGDLQNLLIEIPYVQLIQHGDIVGTIRIPDNQIPLPDLRVSGIEIDPLEPFCTNQDVLAIPFNLLYTEHKMKYSIIFSEEAKKAGFVDITNFIDLPNASFVLIDLPQNKPTGSFTGTILLQCDENADVAEEYPFSFQITYDSFEITAQPVAVQTNCGATLVELAVEISGNASSLQWYRNGQPVVGANSLVHETNIAGNYHLEITGNCAPVRSITAVVNVLESIVKIKWSDMLYVENTSGEYQKFQWYHNGAAINGATHVYHSDENGFEGAYSVRCYKSDGSYDETCPVFFDTRTKALNAGVYPTIVRANEPLNIDIQGSEYGESATVDIFSSTGVLVYSKKTDAPQTKINTGSFSKGIYIVKITLSSGKVFNEKVVVI